MDGATSLLSQSAGPLRPIPLHCQRLPQPSPATLMDPLHLYHLPPATVALDLRLQPWRTPTGLCANQKLNSGIPNPVPNFPHLDLAFLQHFRRHYLHQNLLTSDRLASERLAAAAAAAAASSPSVSASDRLSKTTSPVSLSSPLTLTSPVSLRSPPPLTSSLSVPAPSLLTGSVPVSLNSLLGLGAPRSPSEGGKFMRGAADVPPPRTVFQPPPPSLLSLSPRDASSSSPTTSMLGGTSPYGRKLFPCPQCRYTTDRRNNLKRHMLTMHQLSGKQLECCGVLFHTKAALREHALIFHYQGYICFYCNRRFCRKALLKRHLSVHNGQKEFICSVCDYATSHKSNLERHRRVHVRQDNEDGEHAHDDVTSDDVRSNVSDPHSTVDVSGDDLSVSSEDDEDEEINVHSDD